MSTEETRSLSLEVVQMFQIRDGQAVHGLFKLTSLLFKKLTSLELLLIEAPLLIPQDLRQMKTVKRLCIKHTVSVQGKSGNALTIKNVVWLLNFGVIEEAALRFVITNQDFEWLSDHSEAISRASKVKKLALSFDFAYETSDRKTWWGLGQETNRKWNGEDKKTATLALLLSSVDRLECLEISGLPQQFNPGDQTRLNLNFLPSLNQMFGSLKHLRLMHVFDPATTHQYWEPNNLSVFHNLKVISLDRLLLGPLKNRETSPFPASLEKIILTYYLPSKDPRQSFDEEFMILRLLESHSQSLKLLREVYVPSKSINGQGEAMDALGHREHHQAWAKRRNQLERSMVFKTGRVKLKTFNVGDDREC